MATNMPSENVYSFLEKSIENQKTNIQAVEMMLRKMQEIESNVSDQHAEIKVLAKQISDENRLLPAEIDDLYEAVRVKSISIVKNSTDLEGDEFKKEVGKTRKFIWSKLKKHYGISKYIHLPRKHFEDALTFVRTFSVLDHI